MCLTSALPKILTEVETFGERCGEGGEGTAAALHGRGGGGGGGEEEKDGKER